MQFMLLSGKRVLVPCMLFLALFILNQTLTLFALNLSISSDAFDDDNEILFEEYETVVEEILGTTKHLSNFHEELLRLVAARFNDK